ncbi:cytidine deaminase [candidate division WOR-3 bacterium JGI_Cruoil_03_51_56]|uniref:Cytidine deaminase n=1 Tax=candidate division WOR-3 bacterium JGI_Cruoil_03_51_56 TaxID=1973747 RepID=A0A235BRZ1_UNCW3|nr:MAG: cytidine deaminase [candidate division WOR-3 bacterium JGI_Cruoil_03_51_56]
MNKVTQNKMLAAAKKAALHAYAPYSDFKVGAAALDEQGRIYAGCNVENTSYGLTICAERAAIFKAVCAGAKSIKAVLVFTDTKKLTRPCGACLQVIAEFGENPEIILANKSIMRRYRLKDLLPERFG